MKKSKLLLSFLLLSTFLNSQDLDQAYLDSLPENVKEDLLSKIDANKDIEKPVYRRASTNIDKKNEDIEDLVFGAEFFDTIQSSFMPINEPNFDSSYILDAGDVLKVQLIGQEDSINSYLIQRDGSINLPVIGKLVVAGLPIKEVSTFLQSKVNNAYIGTQSFLTLENVRDINILVAGNAFNPGIYTLSGNSNMLHALFMAGGIDSFGSYRKIDLKRNGEVIRTLDMYDVIFNGDINITGGLRSGDSIVVNPAQNIVNIESGVNRPGKYELKYGETVKDLLVYANGISKDFDLENIIVKYTSNGQFKSSQVNYNEINKYRLKNGDNVFLREFRTNKVKISGAVKNPGLYEISVGTKLSDFIKIAGGYEDFAYPFGGILLNKSALKINEKAHETLYQKFLYNIVSNKVPVDDSLLQILKQINQAEVNGRVIAEFDLDILDNYPDLDLLLNDQDVIIIPSLTQQVFIHGEISNPGALRYSSGKDINYYISNSGGALKSADLNNLFIVHPNGETQIYNQNSRLSFLLDDEDSQLIYPGSIIYIPRSTNFINGIEIASIWAPIISSIALSITSLSVLNNN